MQMLDEVQLQVPTALPKYPLNNGPGGSRFGTEG
jgi:hypothetical protein